MRSDNSSPLDLLEPGALLGGPLARSLAISIENAERLAPGTRVGAFRIEEAIGAGGMGIVYRAQRDDGAFRQTVAIKCLAQRSGERSHEMFLRERQILAELRHPHIARLIDGGQQQDGRLWFAMEQVEGERVDEHVRAHGLHVEARLRLLLEVIDAVGFAHGRLLIHRDIKPANVLVDGDGRAKLLDFGIATLAGESDVARAYSPAWASPEQRAGAEVGPASDQYQLCLLLDAVLRSRSLPATGHSTTPGSATKRARDDDREPPPRAADPAGWMPMAASRRRELAAVVARASHPDPQRRYGSVAEMADELRRWLERRPLATVGGGMAYTMGCAIRRNPVAAFVGMFAIVAMIALAAFDHERLRKQRDRAESEAARARAVTGFLTDDILANANPFRTRDADLSMHKVLDLARGAVAERFRNEPQLESEVREMIGAGYAGLGAVAEADQELQRAWTLRQGFDSVRSERSFALRVRLADLARYASEHERAEHLYASVLADLRSTRAADDGLVLDVETSLIELWGFLGRDAQALAASEDVLARMRRSLGESHADTLRAQNSRAHMLLTGGRADEALALFRATVALGQRAQGEDAPDTLRSMKGEARALRSLRRLDEAETLLRQLLPLNQRVFGDEHPETLGAQNELGVLLSSRGNQTEAIALFRAVLPIQQRRLGEDHQSALVTRFNIANDLLKLGQPAEAESQLRAVHAVEVRTRGEDDPSALTTLAAIADATLRQGRAVDALPLIDQALERSERTMQGRPERGLMRLFRGEMLMELGRADEARIELTEAHSILLGALGAEHGRTRAARRLLDSLPPTSPQR